MSDMFSSFYLTMLSPSQYSIFHLPFFYLFFSNCSPFQLMHDMSALERGYQEIADLHRTWAEKVVAANTDKAVAIEHLQATTEQEENYQEEIFHTKIELESDRAELELAQQSVKSQEA